MVDVYVYNIQGHLPPSGLLDSLRLGIGDVNLGKLVGLLGNQGIVERDKGVLVFKGKVSLKGRASTLKVGIKSLLR